MLTRPLEHLIHTNVGTRGYETLLVPSGCSQHEIGQVAEWLRSLQPTANYCFASSFFVLGQAPWMAMALVIQDFGGDLQKRDGVLCHAFLTPISEEDGGAAHQVALWRTANQFLKRATQLRGDSLSKIASYKSSCRQEQRVTIEPVPSEQLRQVVRSTTPTLFAAIPKRRCDEVVLPVDHHLAMPERLACAVGALPPLLRRAVHWGFQVRPHENLKLVVREMNPGAPIPTLSRPFDHYQHWLSDRLEEDQLREVQAVLADWTINDWSLLGDVGDGRTVAESRPAAAPVPSHPPITLSPPEPSAEPAAWSDTALNATTANPNAMKRNQQPTETKPKKSRPRSQTPGAGPNEAPPNFPLTTEFVQREMDAMRLALNESVKRRFELLESSLGVPSGTSQPADTWREKVGLWARRLERPLLYALVIVLLAPQFWSWVRPSEGAGRGETVTRASQGSVDNGAADPAVDGDRLANGSTGEAGPVGPRAVQSADGVSDGAGTVAQIPAYQENWDLTFVALAAENPKFLADWCARLSRREGLRPEQISNRQATNFEEFAKKLREGGQTDLAHIRKGLFEYAVSQWVAEKNSDEVITVNLGFDDIPAALVTRLLQDLAPEPLPNPRNSRDAELQAAVLLTWLQSQSAS